MMVKPVALLLCAGEGTRMKDQRTNKVCYEVAGIPAVIRSINNMQAAGIDQFMVVVGSKSEKVMECLAGIPGVTYAYQPQQLGTGNAAMCGLKQLRTFGYHGPVLIVMGDKIIATDVILDLINRYNDDSKAPVFAVQPKEFNPSGGRICIKDGKVCGIYEMLDSMLLYLSGVDDKTEHGFEEALVQFEIGKNKKNKLISAALKRADALASNAVLAGRSFTFDDIEGGEFVNTATYLVDCDELFDALGGLNSDNAQGELYLTDALNFMIENNGAQVCPIYNRAKLLTYSTMEELFALNKYFIHENTHNDDFPFASERIYELRLWGDDIQRKFNDIYGNNPEQIELRRQKLIELLEAFISKYGDRRVVVSRSPGRVNLLGRHIEHRGGSINVMSINRETLIVASPRDDDTVNIANIDPRFPERSFGILESIKDNKSDDWIEFIENDVTLKMVLDSQGDWANYVKASVLRLQMKDRRTLLRGMDMLFCGDIPMAAGLSSSSSIVVATSEAAIAINHMDVQAKDFIHLCGEGEWFVGSRGGSGDHAAMKCGQRDMITHLDFCPFEIGESVKFPEDYDIVVANSFVEAKKSEGAKDKFNQKVACYEIGFMLVKKMFPEYASRLKYLKDINQKTLGISQSKIYKILLSIPQYMTRDEVFAALPEYGEALERIMRSHVQPERYEIRSTMLYGIAECQRAQMCIEFLKSKDYDSLGKLMNISHNGDRVSQNGKPYDYSAGDKYLVRLIEDLSSEEPERVLNAQIYNQPGGYACSTETIDSLVDAAIKHPGVMGAELSGAGLGGCILILVRREQTESLLEMLKSTYYDKNNLPMGAQVFVPIAGSSVI